MKRRKFLKVFSISTLSVTILGMVFIPSFENVIKGIIKEDLQKKNPDHKVVDKFFKKADEEGIWERIFYTLEKREFLRLHYMFTNKFVTLPYRNKYKDLRAEIVGLFLLSTNYFTKREEEVVEFIAVYNPYNRPCSNPFTSLYDQAWLS